MNDNHQPSDELLQFLFGELNDSREAAVRKAVAEDAELAAIAQSLASAVAAVRAENVGQVSDDFNDRLRRRMPPAENCPTGGPDSLSIGAAEPQEVFEAEFNASCAFGAPIGKLSGLPAQTETTRPTFLTRSLTTWRWMMRSPVSRVAAAVIFVLAITGVALWFHSLGATPAFADFLAPILNAKTVKYKMTTERTSQPPEMTEMMGLPAETQKNLMKASTAVVMMLDSNRSRTEWEMPGQPKRVQIWDGGQGKGLWLCPAEKQATLSNITNMPKDRSPNGGDPLAYYRSLLLDAHDKPNIQRESLGEKDIDGHRVIGFRISSPEMVMSVWGDPKTGLPVRVETTVAILPNIKLTMSDFEFNVAMDESLFSLDLPAGYKITEVQNHMTNDSASKENDLIEMFRYYGEWSGGRFPDLLDVEWLHQSVSLAEWCAANLAQPHKTMAKRDKDMAGSWDKLQRGVLFISLLPKAADMHYAGRGVSLGAADTPIFWYRPKDAKKYRVIYADLSVHEADVPPSVHDVHVAQLEKDLIEMLRLSCELSDGAFPPKLDVLTFIGMLAVKNRSVLSPQQPQERTAKEDQEIAEALTKLLRGLTFIGLLPKEADARYAGRGVPLGAADKPVFWYRPKDAKAYRVVYADLSVRDADAPPAAPAPQPEDDLLDTLREYSKVFGGAFPDSLDPQTTAKMVGMQFTIQMFFELVPGKRKQIEELAYRILDLQKLDPKDEKLNTERSADLNKQLIELVDWEKFAPEKGKLNAEQKEKLITEQLEKYTQARMPKLMAATQRYLPGFLFVSMLPREADAHYAGKGVLLGTADKPIFWYRPKDAKTYRVIYADLSVRDADEAPDMPAAQPEKDLLTMFRHYSKLSGGPFPDSLDADSLSRFLEKKFGIEEGQKPGEKQMQEIMATLMKSQPGLLQEYLAISLKFHSGAMYVNSLPPEADVHYAGKGVSLGAADKPIFWYRPKDAKKYRVIYADLSVRDADKAPNVPDAQPAPAQSSPKQ